MSRDPWAEGGRWLAQAESDLSDGRYLADGRRYAVACFLAQQAAEKALKGLLYAGGVDVVLGHGVGQLCTEVTRAHPEAEPRCPDWAGLDVFYISTRYPDALPSGIPATTFTAAQAAAALDVAADALAFVRGALVRPGETGAPAPA